MFPLPKSNDISIDKLSAVFRDTTNSYKFYWFLSILELLNSPSTKSNIIEFESMYIEMLDMVWFPLNSYKLSFGKNDSFKKIETFILSQNINIDNSFNSDRIYKQLQNNLDHQQIKQLDSEIKKLVKYVPYRFIRPFFETETRNLTDHEVNKNIIELSALKSANNPNECPYYFEGDKIIINQCWVEYFRTNYVILKSYISFYLIKFLEKNNCNVAGLSEKISRPSARNLSKYISCWKYYLAQSKNWKCIYSNNIITENFSLDHFIPWSYNTSDVNWNLIPTFKNINSSKSDTLPSLDKYLEEFTFRQYNFFHKISGIKEYNTIIDDYSQLFKKTNSELLELDESLFRDRLKNEIRLMSDHAKNMGFKQNWIFV